MSGIIIAIEMTSLTLVDSITMTNCSQCSSTQKDEIIKLSNMINNKVGLINFWINL